MAENKTKPGKENIDDFLKKIDQQKRDDCYVLIDIMKKISGEKPVLWGGTMIGFGHYHYKYESGREGDMFMIGFSPRKANLTIYMMPGSIEHKDLFDKLGKHKTSKACLYINKLKDVDIKILEKLIAASYKRMASKKS